jgi:hypothetical protein
MPLLIAALVTTSAVVIYLNLTVVSVPVVADANFTTTLIAGTPYLWRGAASELTISSNASILVTYMPVANVVYLDGPLTNVSLGSGKWLIYLSGGRPILAEKRNSDLYVFKLVNMTKVSGLSVLVPQKFGVSETLSAGEASAITMHTGAVNIWRIVDVYTNGTHIFLDYARHNETSVRGTLAYRLPPCVNTTSFTIRTSGYGVSYVVNSASRSAYVMPYQHVVIIPRASARVTIVAK